MRIPFPDNVTWNDRDRVALPIAVIWHGNAVEVDDATPKEQIAALEAALRAFDPKAPTAAELALESAKKAAGEARERMAKDATQVDVHTRLLALELAAGLVE